MARDYVSLITSEHADKPLFAALVEKVAGGFGEIVDTLRSLPASFDLDTAVGVQLDAVGLWIGQPRAVSGVLTVGYFGFAEDPSALTFGEENDPSVGGRFIDEGEAATGTAVLADPEYRLILKAKIVRNQYRGTTEELEDALEFIFGVPVSVRDTGTMTIDLVINGPLSVVAQSLITNFDILPRPAGVSIGQIIYTDMAAQAFDVATAAGTL
jgi:hypothetical protein